MLETVPQPVALLGGAGDFSVYLWELYLVPDLAQSLSSGSWLWGDEQLCASIPSCCNTLISLCPQIRDSADYGLKPLMSQAERYLSSFNFLCEVLATTMKSPVPKKTKFPSGYWSKVAFRNVQKQSTSENMREGKRLPQSQDSPPPC